MTKHEELIAELAKLRTTAEIADDTPAYEILLKRSETLDLIIEQARTMPPLRPVVVTAAFGEYLGVKDNPSCLPISCRDYEVAHGLSDEELAEYGERARKDEEGIYYIERGNAK